MLVKFRTTSNKMIYINPDQVTSIIAGDGEDVSTTIYFVGQVSFAVVPLHVDNVAEAFGYTGPIEPGYIEMNLPIGELNLPVRLFNTLRRDGITTLGELMQLSYKDIIAMRNIGMGMMDALDDALAERGLVIPGHPWGGPRSMKHRG